MRLKYRRESLELTNVEITAAVEKRMLNGRPVKRFELAREFEVSVDSIEYKTHQHLGMSEVSAGLSPRDLNLNQRMR